MKGETARRTALVTGVTSGVGFSLVHHLSKRYHVVAVARKEGVLREAFGENPHVSCYRMDLSDPQGVAETLESIAARHPFIPVLINNAGVNVAGGVESLEPERVRESFQVNCLSAMRILQRLLPAMKENDYGRVINVTSGAPLNCFPGYGAYSASKGALNAFTVTAARECASFNIKINLMSPGPVRSNMAPDAPMDPSVCHPTVDYLLSLDREGPTGRFFWLGYEIPLFPDLEGIQWLEGKADGRYRRVL